MSTLPVDTTPHHLISRPDRCLTVSLLCASLVRLSSALVPTIPFVRCKYLESPIKALNASGQLALIPRC